MTRFAFRASTLLALLFLTACGSPLRPCLPECGPQVDAATVDAQDAGVDANDLDANVDGGPPPVPPAPEADVLPDHVCSLGGWCWISPEAPLEGEWADVASVGTSEAWVVTEDPIDGATPGGALLRYDGTHWRGLVGRGARRVGGSATDDVWFVSAMHDVTHWDGETFSSAAVPADVDVALADVDSSGADDAWIVGDEGLLRRWNGTEWLSIDVGVSVDTDLRSVHVAAEDDVWVAGTGGTVRHWNGTAWSVVDAASDFDIEAIWAMPGGTTVWIGGPLGARTLNTTTMDWRTPTGEVAANITAIAGTAPEAVYLVSSDAGDFRAFATVLSGLDDGTPECEVRAVAPFGTGRYLRVGRRATDGSLACPINLKALMPSDAPGTSPIPSPLGHVRSMHAFTPEAILVYADDGAWRGDPTDRTFAEASTMMIPTGVPPDTLEIGAANGEDDVWLLQRQDAVATIWHWDGAAWASLAAPGGFPDVIFANDGTETWVATDRSVYQWTDGTFAARGAPFESEVVALATAGTTAWATHTGGATLARFDGSVWTDVVVGTWPIDCTPLVAQDQDTVECLGDGGRQRFRMDGPPVLVLAPGGTPPFASGDLRALAGEHGWIFAGTLAGQADERLLWPAVTGDAWHVRSSGLGGGGTLRMLRDGTTWRVVDGSLLEWRSAP